LTQPDSGDDSSPVLDRSLLAESRRARLLAATIEVSGEHGWERATLSEIVTRAGVSKRTVYELFDSKEQCFLAAARLLGERIGDLAVNAFRECSTAREGIGASVGAVLRFCADDPRAARVHFVETAAAGPGGAALWREHVEAMSRHADCALGRVAADLPAHSGSMVVGGFYSVVQGRLLAGQARELPAFEPEIARALWLTVGLD